MELSIKDVLRFFVLNLMDAKILSMVEDCDDGSVHISFEMQGLRYRQFNKGDVVYWRAMDGADKGMVQPSQTISGIRELIEESRRAS